MGDIEGFGNFADRAQSFTVGACVDQNTERIVSECGEVHFGEVCAKWIWACRNVDLHAGG